MRILLGTPIHQCKDYAIERWLKAVSEFDYPYDLLLVDNTDGTEYTKKLLGYCQKRQIKNYRVEHLEMPRGIVPDEKIYRSREFIRREVLSNDYDAWFSLDSDIIVSKEALAELVRTIGEFDFISHVFPHREHPAFLNASISLSIIKREALLKYGFILDFENPASGIPDCWHQVGRWFMDRVLAGNGSYGVISGTIKHLEHLNG